MIFTFIHQSFKNEWLQERQGLKVNICIDVETWGKSTIEFLHIRAI